MIFRGIRTVVTVLVLCAFSLTYIAIPAQAYTRSLSSQDFSKMYYFASKGDAQRLSMAISRGLNINATNINGDTGLCVAVRNQNITAYKTFRAVGANPRPDCSWRIPHFDQFVISHQMTNGSYYARQTVFPAAKRGYPNVASTAAEKISTGSNAWYWIGGAALVGGGVALAAGGGGGGGSGSKCPNVVCEQGQTCASRNDCGGCESCGIDCSFADNKCHEDCYQKLICGPDEIPQGDDGCGGPTSCQCGETENILGAGAECGGFNSCGNCNCYYLPEPEGEYKCGDEGDCGCIRWYKDITCQAGQSCSDRNSDGGCEACSEDSFSKNSEENIANTDNITITRDGTDASGTWGGIYSKHGSISNSGAITLTGGANAVGIMSAGSDDIDTARESDITTAGGNIDNTGDITIESDNSVGIFATTLGSLNESRDLAALGTISNNNDTAITLTGNTVSGIELYGDGNVLNYGDITLRGNGYNVGIYYNNSDSILKTYTNDLNLQSNITNTGTIEITGGETPQENEAFVGIDAFGSEDGELAITNEGTITIEGNADLVGISADNGDINNKGEIKLNISDNDIDSSDLYVTGISAAGSSEITTNEGSTITIMGANAEAIGIDVEDKVSVENNGDISVTGAGEIYGIKAGDEATINGAGDITLIGTNTSETSQTMYGIYAGDDAKITYTGNIKNESTDANVTMIAVQAGDNSEATLGTENPDATENTQVQGDIFLGKGSTLYNIQNTITGNINGGDIYNQSYGIIIGDIDTTGTISNESGSEINVGGTETIIAGWIANKGNIGTSENPFTSITVTGDDSAADSGKAFYNEHIIYGNISAENGTVFNDHGSNITGNITAKNLINNDGNIYGNINITDNLDNSGQIIGNIISDTGSVKNQSEGTIKEGELKANSLTNYGIVAATTIESNEIINEASEEKKGKITADTINAQEIENNYGTINGKITTETLNNATAGATIESSELIARNIENYGTINIGNGTLAANKIGNYTDEENGTISVSAGMTFMPIANSDSDGSGADINLSDVLTFDEANDDDPYYFTDLNKTLITIADFDNQEISSSLQDGQSHNISISNYKFYNDAELNESLIKLNASNTKLDLNNLNFEGNYTGNIIDATGFTDNSVNSTINVDTLTSDTSSSGDLTIINAPSSSVYFSGADTDIRHESKGNNFTAIIADKFIAENNINIYHSFDENSDYYDMGNGNDLSFVGISTRQWNDNASSSITINNDTAPFFNSGGYSFATTGIKLTGEGVSEIQSEVTVEANGGSVYGIYASNGAKLNIKNDLTIDVDSNTNNYTESSYGIYLNNATGSIDENVTLSVRGESAYGVYAAGGAYGYGTGMYSGAFINNGHIDVTSSEYEAIGMYGDSPTTESYMSILVNKGTINVQYEGSDEVDPSLIGMYGKGQNVTLYNDGTIIAGENEYTNGDINPPSCDGVDCNNNYTPPSQTNTASFMLMRGARMYNTGTISQDSDMNFDEMGDGTGEVYFGKTAVFEAPSVSGTAIAMADHTTGSNQDSYTTTGNFVADNVDVNVKSGTAMFMARSSGSGVRMQRIAFTNLLQDKELANYLESNYQSGNRVDLFDDLKQANDNNSLYDAAKRALGHEFFPLLAWQNQQRVRHFNHTMEDLVLDDDTLKSERTVAKFDSNYTEQDAANGLPGYEDKIYGVSGLFDKEVNKNYRFGVGIGLYNAYAEFDDDDTRRDAIVQAYQTNRFDYDNWGALVMPFAGYSRGEYKRYAANGKYEPHFNVWYLGLNNRAYLKQDFGNWRIEPTVELNLSTIYQDKVKENNNITVKGQNSLSVEAGAGAYAKRKYDLGENGALEVKGGAMYYRELNSKAYDDHSAQMYGMDGNYHISGYENDRNRAELSFKADYKIGKWSVYGEVSQSFADNDNTVYNAGIRLAF